MKNNKETQNSEAQTFKHKMTNDFSHFTFICLLFILSRRKFEENFN